MTILRYVFILVVSVMALIGFQAKSDTIGVSLDKSTTDAYVSLLRRELEKSAAARSDIDVKISDAGDSHKKQLEQVDNLIAEQVDAIIVVPGDDELFRPTAERAAEANIPIVFLNRLPPDDNLPGRFSVVASNEAIAGRLQMRMIGLMMQGKGDLVILRGTDGHSNAIFRTAGVKEILAEFPEIKLVREAAANWRRAGAKKVVVQWLEAGVHIDAVIANNDEMAIGAIRAFEQVNVSLSNVYIAGVDATPFALDEMERGALEVSIFQNARGQVEAALDDALKLARGQTTALYNWVPFELVTRREVSEYRKKYK